MTGLETQANSVRTTSETASAGLLYSAYVLLGLVALGLGALTWRVVRKGAHVERGISIE